MLRGGQAKSSVTLVGFGNAQRVGHDNVTFQDPDFEGLTGGGKLSGGCKAPEQLAGEARSASDMYGLGCSLLYLLTGDSRHSILSLHMCMHMIRLASSASIVQPGCQLWQQSQIGRVHLRLSDQRQLCLQLCRMHKPFG